MWNELTTIVEQTHWDVIAICESHWYGGTQGRCLPGFNLYQAQRPSSQKKGGGLIVMVKDDIQSFQIQPPRTEADGPQGDSEILWVGVKGRGEVLAIGIT